MSEWCRREDRATTHSGKASSVGSHFVHSLLTTCQGMQGVNATLIKIVISDSLISDRRLIINDTLISDKLY